MDQREHDVEEDLKNILHTRLALANKIQLLERRVEDTVRGTKMAAMDAVDLAKTTAVDFIESATHNLNPSVQARRRPWIMVGSIMAIGFLVGLIERRRRRAGVYSYYPPETAGAGVMPPQGRERTNTPRGVYPFYGRERPSGGLRFSRSERSEERTYKDYPAPDRMPETWGQLSSLWAELKGQLIHERNRLQEAALHAGRSFVQDLAHVAGQTLIDQLSRFGSSPEWERPSRTRYE